MTIYHVLVIMGGIVGKNLKNHFFVEEVLNSLTHMRGLAIEPLKTEDYAAVVDLMNNNKIDYEDALHLVVAIRVGAEEIVSNDKDFSTSSIKTAF